MFTVGNAQCKVNKHSCLLEMLSEDALQGSSIEIMFGTSFISSFAPSDYFILLPCDDPVRLFLFRYIRLCHWLPNLTHILLRGWFCFSPLLRASIVKDDQAVYGVTLIHFSSQYGNIKNEYGNRG
jgi:hypothetical protein